MLDAALDVALPPPSLLLCGPHPYRKRYRECVKEEIGHTVASPIKVEEELRHLFRRACPTVKMSAHRLLPFASNLYWK